MRAALILVILFVANNLEVSLGICSLTKHPSEYGFWLKCSNASIAQVLECGNSSLSMISISQSKIPSIPSYAFTKFAATLVSLKLHACGISTVSPHAFKDLSHLRTLSLSNNNITEVRPEWFAGLTWLQEVDLSFNNIEKISSDAFAKMANVHILNINHNRMTCLTIGNTFAKMTCLKKIRINGNPWTIHFRAKMTRWFHDKGIDYNGDSQINGINRILDELFWLCTDEDPGICESETRMTECVAVLLLNQFRSAAATSESYARSGLQCTRERVDYATCVHRSDDKKIVTNGEALKMFLSGLWATRSS